VAERIESAPRSYLLQQEPATIVRHAELLSTAPPARSVRVTVTDGVDCRWVDVVARDSHGLLAAITAGLAAEGLEVTHATVATWPDAVALESFCVRSAEPPSVDDLERAIEAGLDDDLASPPMSEVELRFDHHASPWHTTCEVDAPDKPRLLHHLATAFAAAGVDVIAATITGRDGRAYDNFLLDRPGGSKLGPDQVRAIVGFVERGVVTRRRRFRKPSYVTAETGAETRAAPADEGVRDLTRA
jgi:[protein-PII] uridylyltransferase